MPREKKMGLGEFLGEQKAAYIPEASLPSGPRAREVDGGRYDNRRRGGYGDYDRNRNESHSTDAWRDKDGPMRSGNYDTQSRGLGENWRSEVSSRRSDNSMVFNHMRRVAPAAERPSHLRLNLQSRRNESEQTSRYDLNPSSREPEDKYARAFSQARGSRFNSGSSDSQHDRMDAGIQSRNSGYNNNRSENKSDTGLTQSLRTLHVDNESGKKPEVEDKKSRAAEHREERKQKAEAKKQAEEESKRKAAEEKLKKEEFALAQAEKGAKIMSSILSSDKLGQDLVVVATPVYEENGRVLGAALFKAVLEVARDTAKASANWIAPAQYGALLQFGMENAAVDDQLQAIYALQVFYASVDFPKGVLEKCFMALYSLDIIEEAAFIEYKYDVDSALPGRMKAIVQTSNWLTWLETPESEEEEAEDGE